MDSKHFNDNTFEERIEIFQDFFDRDLESYFSSSILCCDSCYDDFARAWPGTAAHDADMQSGYTNIDYFLSNSRIQDAFFQEEIETLRRFLSCPECSAPLTAGFWIHEHKVSPPREFWRELDEIHALAENSPFLLLTHPFAKRTFETIMEIAGEASPERVQGDFFRCRVGASLPTPALGDFGPAPAARVQEGRYNHAGQPMLYLAASQPTALAEVGVPGQHLHVGEIGIDTTLNVLDLRLQEDEAETPAEILIQLLARSTLCAAPRLGDGWKRPEYVFSRFVADCARHAGFDAIRYGSTKDPHGENLVLLEPSTYASFATFKGAVIVPAAT